MQTAIDNYPKLAAAFDVRSAALPYLSLKKANACTAPGPDRGRAEQDAAVRGDELHDADVRVVYVLSCFSLVPLADWKRQTLRITRPSPP